MFNQEKLNIIVLIVLTLAIVIVGALVLDVKKDLAKLSKELAHMEEEAHETGTAVKRMQAQEALFSSSSREELSNQPKAITEKTEYDFGQIRKSDGVVKTDFVISNNSSGELLIGDITTSCSCTSAKIDKKKIAAGDKAILTVNFDPNFHKEPEGRFFRSVFAPTNDPNKKEIEFKIFIEIKNENL